MLEGHTEPERGKAQGCLLHVSTISVFFSFPSTVAARGPDGRLTVQHMQPGRTSRFLSASAVRLQAMALFFEGLALQEKCPWAGSRAATPSPKLLPTLSKAVSEPFAPRSASSTLYYKILFQLSVQSHCNYNHCCNHIQLLSPPPRRESTVTGLRGLSVPPQHPGNRLSPAPTPSFPPWSRSWGLALTLRDASFIFKFSLPNLGTLGTACPPGTVVAVRPGAVPSNPLS